MNSLSAARSTIFAGIALTLSCPAGTPGALQPAAAASSPWQHRYGPLEISYSLDGGLQTAAGLHGFWGLADTFAPAVDYPDEHLWLEGYLRPGAKAAYTVSERFALYGGLAVIASGTLGEDYFMEGDTGRVLMEDAYLGAKWKTEEFTFDLSAGRQAYTIGHSLLIGVGAGNGFERGAAATFPRKSWEMTAIARLTAGEWSLDGFCLDAHELSSADTGTKLAGAKLEWKPGADFSAGAAYFKVTNSTSPYPQAPVTLIENGRDGLETFDLFWKWAPADSGFSFLGEVALQRQGDINQRAWGGGLELGYRWASARYSPRLSYSPRYFSGDDPGTADKLERFDPLFFDGGPATWSSGSNSSFAFYNSNVISHRLRLELTITPRDYVNLNYWFTHAAETDSPIQFGQAARIAEVDGAPAIISGVPSSSLSHDVWLEHTHVFNQNWFLTWGVALSIPGDGIKAITDDPEKWWGGLVNVTFKY